MSDKMKKQQEEARKRAAKQQRPAPAPKVKADAAATTHRETRNKTAAQGSAAEDSGNEPTTGRKRGRPRKNEANGNTISSFFQKADVAVKEDNPTVQEALEKAADEYEANPTALGEQELVATQQPSLVTGGTMRTYQLEGLEWLKTLWMNGLCGILADEMGLGKTIQAISMIAFLKENKVSGPFLIAAPVSTLSNWVDEINRWTPEINVVLYHGSKPEREFIRKEHLKLRDQGSMDFPVVCTSYDICINDRKFLAQYKWRYIIVVCTLFVPVFFENADMIQDEGHRLKNMNCRLIKELMTYDSANRLLITGTPLQNNISELWSLLHFLLPDVFNDLDSFESWFDFSSVLDDNSKAAIIERRKRNLVTTMHSILKPFLLRRVKTDVEHSLPKKREYILYAPMTPEQKELYREILRGSGRQWLEDRALERLNAKSAGQSRSSSRKRRRESDGENLSVKSQKSSGMSTPSNGETRASPARRRRVKNYKEVSDQEFNAQLRRLEQGIEEEDEVIGLSDGELEEMERAQNLKLASTSP